ncbi:MAG TPA: carbon-nitrogen hydrolase family protein [Bacteroidia bacterium]|nr:carbon-nitrogen hydrolase family protein [Bacteroidia bacterium]
MKIALASPLFPKSIMDALYWVEKLIKEAAAAKAEIICFPESYIPGYPWPEYTIEKSSPEKLKAALDHVTQLAKENSICVIIPMDWYHKGDVLNIAHVISSKGVVLGYQAKNQLDPSEDNTWIPGTERILFEEKGIKFGIVICHEGFRYPETVRWAAMRNAAIVFHPLFAGSDTKGEVLTEWGDKKNPYYEKAAMLRAMENTIYFASVNYTTRFSEAATALIAPDGQCISYQPYGQPGVLIATIDEKLATGKLAKRFKTVK